MTSLAILAQSGDTALKPAQRVVKLLKLKVLKKQVEVAIKEQKTLLLTVMEDNDVAKLETGKWVLTRFPVTRYKVTDHTAAIKWFKRHKVPFDTQEVLADWVSETYKRLIGEKGKKIDGIESTLAYQLKATARKEK
jgi:hypothetical protein